MHVAQRDRLVNTWRSAVAYMRVAYARLFVRHYLLCKGCEEVFSPEAGSRDAAIRAAAAAGWAGQLCPACGSWCAVVCRECPARGPSRQGAAAAAMAAISAAWCARSGEPETWLCPSCRTRDASAD